MKKLRLFLNLSISLGIVMLILSACTQAPTTSSDLPDGYVLHQIAFPTSDTEKTDFNKDIFEVTPFNIQVAFPVGWSTGEFDSQTETYLYSGIWSRIAIYDEEEIMCGRCDERHIGRHLVQTKHKIIYVAFGLHTILIIALTAIPLYQEIRLSEAH